MKIRPYITKIGVATKILIVILVVSVVPNSCVLNKDPFMVPITDQDIRFLKKCIGEGSTIRIAMRDRLREQIKEIVKDDGPTKLVSAYKHPFPPTISEDRSELSSQCYRFIRYGSYAAEDPDFF